MFTYTFLPYTKTRKKRNDSEKANFLKDLKGHCTLLLSVLCERTKGRPPRNDHETLLPTTLFSLNNDASWRDDTLILSHTINDLESKLYSSY